MEENKANEPAALSTDQVDQVSGGDGDCSASISIGSGGVTINSPTSGLGQALIDTYEGVVDVTSHVIERVAS
jgi:hypothetical protein